MGCETVMNEKKNRPHLIISPIGMTFRMKAVCSECNNQVSEGAYHDNREYNSKRYQWKENYLVCPHCKVRYKVRPYDNGKGIKWRRVAGDYVADVANGTFFLWWDRHAWLWSFKYRDEDCARAENTGRAMTREVAERMCEKHKEWKI